MSRLCRALTFWKWTLLKYDPQIKVQLEIFENKRIKVLRGDRKYSTNIKRVRSSIGLTCLIYYDKWFDNQFLLLLITPEIEILCCINLKTNNLLRQ